MSNDFTPDNNIKYYKSVKKLNMTKYDFNLNYIYFYFIIFLLSTVVLFNVYII